MGANFEVWKAICEVKARYCRCLDTKDWAGYADSKNLNIEGMFRMMGGR